MKMRFNTTSLALIPVAVGINYVGKFFASLLKLPLWLDSAGTMLTAMLAGPWIGALTGIINQFVYGLTVDPMSVFYAPVSAVIGISVGFFSRWVHNWTQAWAAGAVVSLLAAMASTPINIWLWGGQTGNIWGDAAFAAALANNWPVWSASFLDEILVDVPDKLLVFLLSSSLYMSLPRRLKAIFD